MSSNPETSDLHDTVGPGMGVPDEAVPIIDALDGLPTLDREEIADRYFSSGNASFWQGEAGLSDVPAFELAKYRLPALDLPSFGEEYPDCGAEIPHVCEDCGHTFEVGRTCARSMCPRCAASWVTKRAPNMVGRIHEAAKMKSAALDNQAVFKHHLAVSPPPEMFIDADDPLDEAFHAIRDMMEAIDMEGVVFYHPYRGADATDAEDDRGEWKKRLFNDRNWEGDVRNDLERSPHFHIIGACPWVPGGETTKAIEDKTGWVIERITERNGSAVSLGDLPAVARALTYCLSHTGIDTSGDANQAQYRAYGSAFHNAEYRDSTEQKAKKAVKWAAPDTLGLSTVGIECKKERPEEEVELEDLDDLDGDTDSADDDEDSGMVKCGADPVDIDRAERFVEDEDWQETAKFADDAQQTLEEWREAGGWRGWVEGQTSLDDVGEDDGDPPPD